MIDNLHDLNSLQENDNSDNSIISIAENYDIVTTHKKIADTQRNAYNVQRKDKNSLAKQLLIEVDYKQKIVIGLSPRQINKEYYLQELRTLLGIR